MHTKLYVLDGRVAVIGSYNSSAAARSNAEVMAVLRDPAAVRTLAGHWREHWGHAGGPGPPTA